MALYKPGDKVTIVHFDFHTDYRCGVNEHMKSFSGTIQEIESIHEYNGMENTDHPEFNKERIYYRFKGTPWAWSCEMFEESYEI